MDIGILLLGYFRPQDRTSIARNITVLTISTQYIATPQTPTYVQAPRTSPPLPANGVLLRVLHQPLLVSFVGVCGGTIYLFRVGPAFPRLCPPSVTGSLRHFLHRFFLSRIPGGCGPGRGRQGGGCGPGQGRQGSQERSSGEEPRSRCWQSGGGYGPGRRYRDTLEECPTVAILQQLIMPARHRHVKG